jgi:hypothetical protein
MNMEETSTHQHEAVFCQSCGMPMPEAELLGSEQDGTKNEDYCIYCYEAGEFKQPDLTLQGMTDLCTGFMVEEGMDEAAAHKLLAATLPSLKRWKTAAAVE